jgi:ABC-type nitrate/sulfonate/bicarbonate transport system substrate-binding protein/outer membrane protein OmpA-like peptidoglycan-associated protein
MGETESRAKRALLAALLWVLLILLGAGGVVAYKWLTRERLRSETGSESRYRHEVALNLDSFSGYSVLRSPEMRALLKAEGVRLNLVDDQADYAGRVKALASGKADMAVFTVDSLLKAGAKAGEFPATIVLVIDETKGADAIVAHKAGVGSVQDLDRADARFVLTPDSPSEFLARVTVASFNLPHLPERWIAPANGAADVYAQFRKAPPSDPKAFVLWEPYVSKALKEPDAHVLLASDKIKGYIVDVLVARRQFLVDHQDVVGTVVKAYLRAAYTYAQAGRMADLVIADAEAAGERLSRQEAERLVAGIWWKNTLENYAHFGLLGRPETGGLDDLEEILEKITTVLAKTGALSRSQVTVTPNELFFDKILADLKAAKFHPGRAIDLIEGAPAPAPAEAIRAEAELPPLSEGQWQTLAPVGEMRIESLSFLRGTAELTLQGRRDLEELARILRSMPQYYLTVTGRARAEGDLDANKRLAEERARVAAQDLVQRLGISPNRIRAVALPPSDKGAEAQSVAFELGQRPY